MRTPLKWSRVVGKQVSAAFARLPRNLLVLGGLFIITWYLIQCAWMVVLPAMDVKRLVPILLHGRPLVSSDRPTVAAAAALLIVGVLVVLAFGLRKVLAVTDARLTTRASQALSPRYPSLGGYLWLLRLVLAAGFLAASFTLHWFNIAGDGFDTAGIRLLAYQIARVAFAGYVFYACIHLGLLAMEQIAKGSAIALKPVGHIIVAFFLGATLLAVTLLLVGFVGWLSRGACLILMTAILLVPQNSNSIGLSASIRQLRDWILTAPRWQSISATVLWLMLFLLVMLVIVARVVFPIPLEGDVWEHYLNYYREVASSGRIAPNEVWSHFFLSKGASLFFFATQAGDLLATPLVSAAFIAAAALAIFDLLRRHLGMAWAMAGVTLFMAYLYGDLSSALFFKHHGVFLGYVVFFAWALSEYHNLVGPAKRAVLAAVGLSSLYIGFYQSIPTAVVAGSMVMVFLVSVAARDADTRYLSAWIFVGSTAGIFSALAVNYAATGMIEIIPIRLFWKLADLERARAVVSETGVNSFLLLDNNFQDISSKLEWLKEILRWQFFSFLLPPYLLVPAAAAAAVVLVRSGSGLLESAPARLAAVCACFLLSAIALAVLIQAASMNRLYQFTVPPIIMILLVLLHIATKVFLNLRGQRALVLPLLVVLASVGLSRGISGAGERWLTFVPYAFGSISLKQAFNQTQSYRKTGYSMASGMALVRMMDTGSRAFSLTYDNGFMYALPGRGIMSEPTYALGIGARALFEMTPQSLREHLQSRRIDYFMLDLRRPLFSSLAFASLFAASELSHHFRVVYEEGDTYILTWRKVGDRQEFSQRLTRLLELKQSGALHGLFSDEFRRQEESTRDLRELPKLVSGKITQMSAAISDVGTKALLMQAGLEVASSFSREVSNRFPISATGTTDIEQQNLSARWIDSVRSDLKRRYRAEFGSQLAAWLAQCDERYPFASEYQLNVNTTVLGMPRQVCFPEEAGTTDRLNSIATGDVENSS